MNTIGIDPGLEGGFAVLDPQGVLLAAGDIPTAGTGSQRRVDVANLAIVLRGFLPARAVIEHVSAMPGQGVASTFRFAMATGAIAGVAGALGLPAVWVPASKWKRASGLTADKERSRLRAIETWPGQARLFARKRDHGRAEAALIARWGIASTAATTQAMTLRWPDD